MQQQLVAVRSNAASDPKVGTSCPPAQVAGCFRGPDNELHPHVGAATVEVFKPHHIVPDLQPPEEYEAASDTRSNREAAAAPY